MASLEKLILLYKGADTDTDIEISSLEEGVYVSSVNMRATSIGAQSSRKKIAGETSILDLSAAITSLSYNPLTYVCIGGIAFDDYKIFVLASTGADPPLIVVDGDIMVVSANLLFTYNNPLQIIATSSGNYITIFLNDRETVPLIFDLKDIIAQYNSGVPSAKYFADFELEKYTPRLNIPLDLPKFSRIVSLSGNGLKAGKYSYQLRYVNDDGVGTAWSIPTKFIPVAGNIDSRKGVVYAGESAYGELGANVCPYGIELKIRVTNQFDYSYLELKRTSHCAGFEYESAPAVERIKVNYDILAKPYSVATFIDHGDQQWLAYEETLEIDTQVISKAAAIRYYKGRFVIMNPTYYTKILDITDLFLEDSTYHSLASVILKDLGSTDFGGGYGDPRNEVEYLSLMRGERYGWYLVAHDSVGGRSFAIPYKTGVTDGVDDFTNYMIPNRRETISAQTNAISGSSPVTAADVGSNVGVSVSETHEVFNPDPVQKTYDGNINIFTNNFYNPFTPTGSESTSSNKKNISGYNYIVNDQFDGHAFSPAGFNNSMVAAGMQFTGIDRTNFPDYIKAFSIVRTQPAGRVVCQGLGFYSLNEKDGAVEATKDLKKFWFFSPDIDPAYGIKPGIFDDIIDNPDQYQIQLVSPLGFHSELYADQYCDLVAYAEILHDAEIYNFGDTEATTGRGDGYVAFGMWRNSSTPDDIVESSDFIFDIDGAETETLNGKNLRVNFLKLTIDTTNGIYKYDGAVVPSEAVHDNFFLKYFHEPVYIVNIIKTDASALGGDIINCVDTGHIQKLDSLIGVGTGEDLVLELVNERKEDCIRSYYEGSAGVNSYVWVNGKPWLTNVDFITSAENTDFNGVNSVIAALEVDGFYNDGYLTVYGIAYSYSIAAGVEGATQGNFIAFSAAYFKNKFAGYACDHPELHVPAVGDEIVVKYDSRMPITVFSGDTYIGTAIAPFIDCMAEYQENFTALGANTFYLSKALPFFTFNRQSNYTRSTVSPFHDNELMWIRQLMVLFTCESRMNLNMLYNDSFPKKHYVRRPITVNGANFESGALAVYEDHYVLAAQYYADYKDEYLTWTFGGFHFPAASNKDYFRQPLPGRDFTKPQVGFIERLNFPNTIIHSLKRNIPGTLGSLKAFPSLNKYVISDAYGSIVYGWDSTGPKGNNLFAITERGVCLLLTEKSMLYSYTGEQVGAQGANAFIVAELWLAERQGLDYKNYLTVAEYKNLLFMANSVGVFMLDGNDIVEITDTYKKELQENLFPELLGINDSIRAVVDHFHKEYWVYAYANGYSKVFVYDFRNKKWAGQYTYPGEIFVSNEHEVYSIRDNEIYQLDLGTQIDGALVEASLTARIVPEFGKEVDCSRIKIFSEGKPTSVEFANNLSDLPEATLDVNEGVLYLKDYGFWTNKIPVRVDGSRIQGRALIVKVIDNLNAVFNLKVIGVKYRKLRAQ